MASPFLKPFPYSMEMQADTTRGIAENIAQVTLGISDVNDKVAQSSTQSEDMVSRINDMHAKAGDIAGSSSEVNDSARRSWPLPNNSTISYPSLNCRQETAQKAGMTLSQPSAWTTTR